MVATLGLRDDAPAPVMDVTYQLDMLGVLRATFGATFSNLGTLWAAGLAVYTPALLLVLLAAVLPLSADGTRILLRIGEMADRLMSLVLTGCICHAVFESLQGRKAPLGEVIRFGFSRWGRVFVVSLFAGLLTILGFVLCVVPGFFVMAAVWLAVPIAVLEDEDAGTAIARSRAITEGNRTRGLGVNIALLAPMFIAGAVIFGGVALAFALVQGAEAQTPPRVEAAVQFAVSVLLIPLECLYGAAAVVAYHELRIHREGAGTEQLAGVFE